MDSGFGSNRFGLITDEILNKMRHSEEFFGKKEKELTKDEIENIVKYLHNPTKAGIWGLKAKWNPENSISKYIESEIK